MVLNDSSEMLLNFNYDWKVKDYLVQLPFHEARMIFLVRSRMFPTKANFPGRWSVSNLCTFCCNVATDEHLFGCCGYMDLHNGEINYHTMLRLNCEMDMLSYAARELSNIHDRLLQVNEDGGLNGEESIAE